jgi:hypothetical protein
MSTLSNKNGAKLSKNEEITFVCEKCDYICSKKYNFDRHLLSTRHVKSTFINNLATENEQNEQKIKIASYCCEDCNKHYSDRTGLWRHRNKGNCSKNLGVNMEINNNNDDANMKSNKDVLDVKTDPTDKDLIIMLINENKELKTMMLEQQNMVLKVLENGTTNNSNNTTHTNSHNKAFNLNFFLNETCKEAMNIGEFVDSLKMELSDLERVGEKGYIEGITSIIVKNLKALDITKRPVHCTDKKRETIYIKDADKWEKDEDKSYMHKLIKRVVSKNMKMFPKYREKHPDCMTYHSKFGDQYQKIIYESMGGKGDNDFEKNEKIIKNVLKEVVVDKNI